MIRENFAIGDLPDIEIRIESGRVELHEGPAGKVDVEVDGSGMIVEQRGRSVLITNDPVSPWTSRGSVSVVVVTPAGSDLQIAVASAQVNVRVDLDKVDFKSASGDAELQRLGTMVAKTASGDVSIVEVKRSLRFSSASGDLDVDRASGSVSISTASGDVSIRDCDATFEANTASGDVHLGDFRGKSASFKTMSGSVSLGIPGGSNVDLDANLLSGKLFLPDTEPRPRPPERHISIKAKLTSGDLTIERT